MADLTRILAGWTPSHLEQHDSPERQLLSAIERAGMVPPDAIYLDGQIHRWKTKKGGTSGDKTGWYVAFGDGIPAGRFGDWAAGTEHPWRADQARELSVSEQIAFDRRMAEAKAARDAARAQAQHSTAEVVAHIWEQAPLAPADHDYLRRKGIGPNGARVTGDGRLIVPLYQPDGTLSSLQYIAGDGEKLYHLSGSTKGALHVLGSLDGATVLYLAEGFATGATIHELTGQPCALSYSASNLVPVAETLTSSVTIPVVIVADNDRSGTGQRYAEQAAAKYGCRYILPPDVGDANDFAQAAGSSARVALLRIYWLRFVHVQVTLVGHKSSP